MKLSTPTLFAILATTAVVGAAPSTVSESTSEFTGLVKKSDISDALSIIEELGQLNQKRGMTDDENELFELSKRADSLLGQLITALANSGIIGQVWDFLTTDSTLRNMLFDLTKKGLQAAITYGPSLIKAIYNSGFIQNFFSLIWNNADLRNTLFSAAKVIFKSGLNLLKAFLGTGSNSAAPAAATPAAATPAAAAPAAAAAKREALEMQELDFDPELYYDKRDMLSIAESVATAIKNTGIVQSLVQKVLADPQASVSFLTSALKNGLIVGQDIYNWSKNSGVLDSAINWMKEDGTTYAKEIASFIGSKIVSGEATVSDVDNASTGTVTTTTAVAAATTLVRKRLY